jgi:hypothetical protein
MMSCFVQVWALEVNQQDSIPVHILFWDPKVLGIS